MAAEDDHGQLNVSWKNSCVWGTCLFVAYLVVAASPAVVGLLAGLSVRGFVLNLALGCALVGFAILTLQVVLASRFKWLDYPFGLDVVVQFHGRAALLAGLLLVCHPILLMVAHGNLSLLSLQTSWQVYLGKGALVLLLLGIVFAVYFTKLGIDYNVWRFMHKGMIIVVILGFVHGLLIGPDIQRLPVRIYWVMLFAMAAGIFAYRNLIVPLWISRRFTITDVHQETHDTYTLTFEPRDRKPTARNPGQFMFVKFIRPGRPSELHPFTISASPLKTKILQATIKQSGNFTNTIDQTQVGDEARIEAPYGRFSLVHEQCSKLVFIAGGVGITPIMSMLRYLKESNDRRPVLLLYGNKTQRDILFRDELNGLPNHVTTVHVLSEPTDQWQGPRGYITKDILQEHAGSLLSDAGTHIFLCGPPAMMSKVQESLGALGVPDSRIHCERFTI
jgi:predicted ferric reductase